MVKKISRDKRKHMNTNEETLAVFQDRNHVLWSGVLLVKVLIREDTEIYFGGRANGISWWIWCGAQGKEGNQGWLLGLWPKQLREWLFYLHKWGNTDSIMAWKQKSRVEFWSWLSLRCSLDIHMGMSNRHKSGAQWRSWDWRYKYGSH